MNRVNRGVTLIELAVVLVVVAILLSQAGPAFSAWTRNAQIRTATESMANGLMLARSEAIRRNRSVMFWLTSANAAPATADWLVGCSNPVNLNAQGAPEAAGACPGSPTGAPPTNWIQRQQAADQQTSLPQIATTPAGTSVVTFNSLGMVTVNADGTAPFTQIDVNAAMSTGARPLRVLVSGGQVRMCDPQLSLAADPRGCQ